MSASRESLWSRAMTVAALLAVDPGGLGGVTLRSAVGPTRDLWLARFRALLPDATPWRRLPPGIAEGRLLGGLDLAATLNAGRPIAERGLLAEADGGIVIVPMAERLTAAVVGPLCATLDTGAVLVERDGLALRSASRFGVVLLDEGIEDERAPAALMERLTFMLDLDGARPDDMMFVTPDAVADARKSLAAVTIEAAMVQALCEVGLALGVGSSRAMIFAARAARAAAALDGRDAVNAADVTLAASLVIAPRATMLPASDAADETEDEMSEDEAPDDNPTPPDRENQDDSADQPDPETAGTLTDRLVEAAKAAIPAGLLAALGVAGAASRRPASAGRAGLPQKSLRRGRPAGVRRGTLGQGARLAIVDTLRAAAPWQSLRRQAAGASDTRVLVRREDLRIARYKQRSETTTIFVVDASGSAALNRLGEVKGAVELILAECYVRRDSVALIAFRGTKAEMILPPTRSLARAKRALAGQAGGGGTPLATAIDAAALLADAIRRKGPTPLAVFLTDGRANIGRAGRPGRAVAEADAVQAAGGLRAQNVASLLIDIAPRPSPAALQLAVAMGARYQPLPYVDARVLSQAVLAASTAAVPQDRQRNV
jgi:magnesium chelatase subunit D